jgi:hypothetical protein
MSRRPGSLHSRVNALAELLLNTNLFSCLDSRAPVSSWLFQRLYRLPGGVPARRVPAFLIIHFKWRRNSLSSVADLREGLLAAHLGQRVCDIEMHGREDFVETNLFASRADAENSPSNFQEALRGR